MSKLIFIDVDGTLVDYQGNIPESAIQAIQQARKNGHMVFICTGRSKAELYDDILDIGFDGIIGANGAYVEYQGEVWLHKGLSLETCKTIQNWLNKRNLSYYMECNNGLFGSEHFAEQAQPAIEKYAASKGTSDMTVKKAFPHMIFGASLEREDVNKISFVLHSIQDYEQAKKDFPELEVHTWGGVGETALFGDFGVKDIEKSTAVAYVLEHLQKNKEDTIAFGDAKIDIPMLACCEIGVAMGNGGAEIREMADYVTDDVMEDGLYHAFLKLGLIEVS